MRARFHGLLFELAPGRVFSPRATSEPLVDAALARLGAAPASVADVGTGSGALAITIALRAPHAEVWASDTSAAAVELARRNAAQLGARVHLVHGDLLDGLPRGLDLIVANLPYLPPGAAAYEDEPTGAVFSTGDGLDHYRRLLDRAPDHLASDGALLLQFRGELYEAARGELPLLRARLETRAAAAA